MSYFDIEISCEVWEQYEYQSSSSHGTCSPTVRQCMLIKELYKVGEAYFAYIGGGVQNLGEHAYIILGHPLSGWGYQDRNLSLTFEYLDPTI